MSQKYDLMGRAAGLGADGGGALKGKTPEGGRPRGGADNRTVPVS